MGYAEPNLYPAGVALTEEARKDFNQNPAFRFFGKRLFTDQSLPEFLNEFLLILFSPKRLAEYPYTGIDTCFPSRDILADQSGQQLRYAPQARLNLKLFAFWGASRLDARHSLHRDHFDQLRDLLRQRLRADSPQEIEAIIQDMENLLLGLRSIGQGRTWCAQQFLPLCLNLLAAETLWNEKEAINHPPQSWSDSFETISTYWTINQHRFMARGGEVLYYQLCLALSQKEETIRRWNDTADLGLTREELNPATLHAALEKNLPRLLSTCRGLDWLAEFIGGLETETAEHTDREEDGGRYQSMGWCAADSWREGYLFAVELLRLIRADLGIMDHLALLETACGLHILRTLAARTAALSQQGMEAWPGYLLPITAPEEKNATLRAASHNAYKRLQLMQQRLILDELPTCTYKPKNSDTPEAILEGKKKYLEKVSRDHNAGLFASLAKNQLGLVVPRTGHGERFVLPERVLRLLVLTLVPAQKHLSLDTFKRRMRAWHGFVFDAAGFEDTQRWLSGQGTLFSTRCDVWLRDMLEDGNFLIHLSDACSLVHNPIAQLPEA